MKCRRVPGCVAYVVVCKNFVWYIYSIYAYILRHVRGRGNVHFPCSPDHEQDWQPYPVDPYSAICDDHTPTHTYIRWMWFVSDV